MPTTQRRDSVKMDEYLNKPGCGLINCVRTIPPCVCVFSLGMLKAIVGATLLQLQAQTGSSTETVASLFLFLPAGMLLGNVLIALFYKFSRFRVEYVLATACLILALADLYIPWCTTFVSLATAFTVHGLGYGLCGGGGTIPYLIQTWRDDAGVYVQLTMFALSAGATITPFIVGSFLPPESHHNNQPAILNDTHYNGDRIVNTSTIYPYMDQYDIPHENHNSTPPSISGVSNYTYTSFQLQSGRNITSTDIPKGDNIPVTFVPFLLPVIALIVAFLFYISIPTLERFRSVQRVTKDEGEKLKPLEERPCGEIKQTTSLTFLILAGMFGLFISGIEATYGGWIIAFGIHYDYSYTEIAWAATLFWFGETLSRLTAFFLPKNIPAKYYLCVLLIGLNLANLVYLLAFELHLYVSYVCAFIAGVCISPMIGFLITFIQTITTLEEWMASVLHMSFYAGNMILPFITGFMFANVSPLSFLYVLFVSSFCQFVLLFIMCAYGSRISKKSPLKEPLEMKSKLKRLAAEEMYSSKLSIN